MVIRFSKQYHVHKESCPLSPTRIKNFGCATLLMLHSMGGSRGGPIIKKHDLSVVSALGKTLDGYNHSIIEIPVMASSCCLYFICNCQQPKVLNI